MKAYLYLAAAGLALAGWLGSLWFAFGAGQDQEKAKNALVIAAIQETRDKAQQGAADAIAKLKPQVQIINQKVRETVRVEPVYRECVHAPGVLEDINRALGAEPVGGGKLPPTGTPP